MLKVNEEKILADYLSLVEKKEKGLSAVEADARAYATAHGYNEEQTGKFVAVTQEIQGCGLSDDEIAKLEVLGSYIYIEEAEEPAEKVVGDEPAPTASATITQI